MGLFDSVKQTVTGWFSGAAQTVSDTASQAAAAVGGGTPGARSDLEIRAREVIDHSDALIRSTGTAVDNAGGAQASAFDLQQTLRSSAEMARRDGYRSMTLQVSATVGAIVGIEGDWGTGWDIDDFLSGGAGCTVNSVARSEGAQLGGAAGFTIGYWKAPVRDIGGYAHGYGAGYTNVVGVAAAAFFSSSDVYQGLTVFPNVGLKGTAFVRVEATTTVDC